MKKITLLITLIFSFAVFAFAQNPPEKKDKVVGEVTVTATQANIDPNYQQLRKASETPDAFRGAYLTVNNLVLKRDAATFTLQSGEIYFLAPTDGKTTGAVFFGDGEITLTPPVESEKRMLKFFADTSDFKEQFSQLVLFFTDQTFEEIKESPNAKLASNGSQAARARDVFRGKEDLLRDEFRYNMATRILMDKYAAPRPGFFTAFIEGKKYSKLLYQIDPLGIEEVSPEQVALVNYSTESGGIWTAFHLADEYKKGTATSSRDRRLFDIWHHEIDTTVRGTRLIGTDKITMAARVAGQRVLPFNLFPYLRVKRVLNEKGEEMNFIQEDKNKDGGLALILPVAPEAGKAFTLSFEYEGDGALQQEGSGNFILIPRETWYPNVGGTQFGDRATFDLTFRYPKKYVLVGVGEMVEPEKTDGDLKIAHWSTKDVEMAVAGFNYGGFIKKEVDDPVTGYDLEVYVNKELPSEIREVRQATQEAEAAGNATGTTLGALNTASMANNVLFQAQAATRIYDSYFGKLPHKRVAMTQQPAGFFGQAWATLIFMPYTAFFDDTTRVQLYGIRGGTNGFWKEVAPHEVAHQWWGHAVGWTSYHDQWMSEGFAEFSASLYIQQVEGNLNKFVDFWEEQRRRIIEPSPQTKGKKPYTIGPVTEGYRLNTARTGAVAQNLIYPKGAYILHMLRMMMYDRKEGDKPFQEMMTDFIKSHYNQDVSTEDFKRAVEKHITPKMDVDKNKRMDWFFNQWVYGTEIPAYKLEYSLNNSGGKTILNAKITQSEVSDNFVMLVPLYADFGKGWVALGSATISGNGTLDLGNITLPQTPKRVAICALNDVLATKIENVEK
ncbi:MAG: M1 family aminopeptidase [Pyrinomonadaceae bacterium]